MKKIAFLIIGLFFSLNNFSQVVPNLDWVKYYNPRNTMDNSASALDGNSNIYITGYINNGANKDLVVLKYDSLGTLQWNYTYNNGGDDEGNAITVSSTGEVYVTGYSYQGGTNFDFYTIKLNASGSLIWSKLFDYTNQNDIGIDIKLDEANGYVYMAGTARGTGANDIVVIRYNESSGNLDWNFNFNGSANNDDQAVGLTLANGFNDIIVTGNSVNSSANYDIVTFKLTSSGSPSWSNYQNGSSNLDDRAEAIILAGAKVVVSGMLNNSGTAQDYVTIMFDESSGSTIWQDSYDNGGNESATDLVRDSTGNIAVTGYAQTLGNYEYHTLLYDSTGSRLWTNIENSFISSLYIEPRIACDTIANHFYVSGSKGNSNKDISVYQITPTGNTTWKQEFNAPGNGDDAATGMVVNGIGVVYLSALSTNSTGAYDITTLKISQTPVYVPVNYNFQTDTFNYSNLYYPNSNEILDTTGQVASSVLYYTRFTYPNQYILKDRVAFCEMHEAPTATTKDSLSRVDMVFLGANTLTTPYPLYQQNTSVINYHMAHTGAGGKTNVKGSAYLMIPNIYPSIDLFLSSNGVGSKYYFVVKPGGNPSVIRMDFQGAASTSLTATGNNLIINSQLGSWTFKKPDIYQVTYNPSTMSLGTTSVTGTNGWNSLGSNSYNFNCGSFSDSWPIVIEFDMGRPASTTSSSLNCQWSTYLGGSNYDFCTNVKSNSNNDIFVTGVSVSNNFPPAGLNVLQSSNAGSRDGFIDKYDLNGQRLWSTFIGGENDDYVYSIDYASNGDLYIVGSTQSTLSAFAKSGATNNLTPLGQDDAFILQINSNAQVKKWLTYYGGSGVDDYAQGKFDGSGNFFVIGRATSKNLPIMGTSPTYTAVNSDISTSTAEGFIAKFNSSSSLLWATYIGASTVGTITSSNDGLSDLAFDPNGDLYTVGYCVGTNFPNISTTGSTNYSHYVESSPSGGADGTICRFSNSGQLKWSTYMGGESEDALQAIALQNGHICVTGYASNGGYPLLNSGGFYYSNANNSLSDLVLSIFNSSNVLVHSTTFSGSDGQIGTDIEIGATGEMYIAGVGSTTVFPSPLTQQPSVFIENYSGLNDNFLYCVPNGNTNLIWATNVAGPQQEALTVGPAICLNNQNAVHLVSGTLSNSVFPLFSGTPNVTYFDGTYNNTGDASITKFYLYAINLVTGVGDEMKKMADLMVYPNPTQSLLNIRLKEENKRTFYYIYNTLGQQVQEGTIDGAESTLELSNLAQGMYILELIQKDHKASVKFIKNGN